MSAAEESCGLSAFALTRAKTGVAVVQEEGAFLICSSEEDESMGLPPLSCTGQIISSQTVTAAAYWRYNCETLPIIRIPDEQTLPPICFRTKRLQS